MSLSSKPRGMLGLRLGQDAADAAARLNLHCEQWQAWEGGGDFETCSDISTPVEAFGAPADVRLMRKNGKLAAIELTFRDCADSWERLRTAVSSEFHIGKSDDMGIYLAWRSGEVIQLRS